MSDAQRLFDDARKFAAQFAGLIKAAELFGAVASIDQATSEANARLAAARSAEAEYANTRKIVLAQAEHDVELLKAHGSALLAQKTREAAETIADAQRQADAIIVQAKRDAEATGQRAKQAAAQDEMRAAKARDDHASLVQAIAKRQMDLAALDQSHADLTRQHQDIKAALAALKAKL